MLTNLDQNFSILVVDDDRSNLDVLTHILKQQYKIYVAKTGMAAIKKSIQLLPDLILLDTVMPDMSGYAVRSYSKGSVLTRPIPFILLSVPHSFHYL